MPKYIPSCVVSWADVREYGKGDYVFPDGVIVGDRWFCNMAWQKSKMAGDRGPRCIPAYTVKPTLYDRLLGKTFRPYVVQEDKTTPWPVKVRFVD